MWKRISDKELKGLLQQAIQAPPPVGKEKFLKSLPGTTSRTSNLSFLLSQVAFVQKKVWVISAFVLAASVWVAQYYQQEIVWVVSALMPYVAVSMLAENSRSMVHNMAELEQASRFSLRSVILARMSIVGSVHLILFAILIPFAGSSQMLSFGRTAVYLLVPYLLTTVLGLHVSRWLHYVGSSYALFGVAGLVSILEIWSASVLRVIYESRQFGWWLVALVLLLGMTFSAYYKNLEQTEELA